MERDADGELKALPGDPCNRATHSRFLLCHTQQVPASVCDIVLRRASVASRCSPDICAMKITAKTRLLEIWVRCRERCESGTKLSVFFCETLVKPRGAKQEYSCTFTNSPRYRIGVPVLILLKMACCTRSCNSPVTKRSDARSLCAQFCGYPFSCVPQWLLKRPSL